MEYKIKVDNRKEILETAKEQSAVALETIGLQAEGYTALRTPVDTGRLRDSFTHEVKGDTVFIGSNVEYASPVEFGHHSYAGAHMLQQAMENHLEEYKQIAEDVLSGA
jgi:hypothetical protein